jgi:hypothetical protein
VAAQIAGPPAAAGATAGVALVCCSYTVSTVAIAYADAVTPRLVLPVGMGMYVTKFSLMGALLLALGGTGWPGLVPMAIGICVGVAGWTATQIWWLVHHEYPYRTEPGPGPGR